MGPITTTSAGISSAPFITAPAISPVSGMSATQPVSHSLSNGSVAMGQSAAPPRPPPGKYTWPSSHTYVWHPLQIWPSWLRFLVMAPPPPPPNKKNTT
jgi:hypothetical protein